MRRICAAGALLVLGEPAGAADPESGVAIRCQQLSAEERARVEVRVLTELRTVRAPPGLLELTCEETSVRGGWRKGGELYDARNLSVAPGDDRTEMLLWISSLLLETAGDRTPSPPAQDLPLAPSDAGPEPTETADAPPPESVASDSQDAPPPVPPMAARSKAELRAPEESPPSTPPWSIGAAITYSHYGTTLDGALGPELIGHVGLVDALGASASLSVLFGTEQPASLSSIEGVLSLGADYRLFPGALLSMGPVLSFATLSSQQVSRGSLTVGAEASLRVQWPRPWGGFAQLGFRGLIDERRAVSTDQNGAVTFQGTFIPHWYPFFALGGALERAGR